MKEYEFLLKFGLPDADMKPEEYIDLLARQGCDDATIGIGKKGRIALDFCREASDAKTAIESAISDVKKAIPGVQLIEVGPDLVGVSEIAAIFGVTRQNITKYISKPQYHFPIPVHDGNSQIWHLDDVLIWNTKKTKPKKTKYLDIITEIAKESRKLNFEKERRKLEESENALTFL